MASENNPQIADMSANHKDHVHLEHLPVVLVALSTRMLLSRAR